MAISTRVESWRVRKRGMMQNQYYSGLGENGQSAGWCIYTHDRVGGWFLKETGGKRVNSATGKIAAAKKFGPFDSFDAARAAFEILDSVD